MHRRGVMAPPVQYDTMPLMAPAPGAQLGHLVTPRQFLWLVAGALGLVELLLLRR